MVRKFLAVLAILIPTSVAHSSTLIPKAEAWPMYCSDKEIVEKQLKLNNYILKYVASVNENAAYLIYSSTDSRKSAVVLAVKMPNGGDKGCFLIEGEGLIEVGRRAANDTKK